MILIDFMHLCFRTLFVSCDKKAFSKNIDFNEYKGLFMHNLFNYLRHINLNFSKEYNEIVLCLEGGQSWRKEVYPNYKANRSLSDNLDWDLVFATIDECLDVIKTSIPYKIVKTPRAEGDDVIATLASTYENCLIISEDKDFKQLLKHNGTKLYRPIKGEFVTEYSNKDLLIHILIGDKIDNIPSIKEETIFTKEFLEYIQANDIYTTEPYEFINMPIAPKLLSEFNGEVYKKARFGAKTAEKFIEDMKLNMNENPLYLKHFKRNRTLIDLDLIPEDIKLEVLNTYKEQAPVNNPTKLLEFFLSNRLQRHADNIASFFAFTKQQTSALDFFNEPR